MEVDLSVKTTVMDIDYSPYCKSLSLQDLSDQAYIPDWYTILPESYLDTSNNIFLNDTSPGCSIPSNDFLFSLNYPSALQSALPTGHLEQNAASNAAKFSVLDPDVPVTPVTTVSSAYSPGGEDALAHLPLSPSSLKCEDPDNSSSPGDELTPKRRYGHPSVQCRMSDSSNTPSPKRQRRGSCVPHHQVERKYRDGLNSVLEKLRRVVPSLSQGDESIAIGRPKPTKAMVLSCAIEYIKKIELEKDELREGNERLSGQIRRKAGLLS